MRTVMVPAVKLMDSLSYGKKFVVLGVLSLSVVLLLVAELYGNLHANVRDNQTELVGLQQLKTTAMALQLVQQHRDLVLGNRLGITEFLEPKNQKQQELDAVMHALVQESADITDLQALQALWQTLQAEANPSLEATTEAYAELIEKLNALSERQSEHALLFADNSVVMRHAVELITRQIPRVLENCAQLRSKSMIIAQQKSLSETQKLELLLLSRQNTQDLQGLEKRIAEANYVSPELMPFIQSITHNMQEVARFYDEHVIPDLLDEKYSIKAAYLFSVVDMALNTSSMQVRHIIFPVLEKHVQAQLTKYQRLLYMTVCSPLALLVLIGYLAMGAHLSVMKIINKMFATAKAFAAGDFQQRMQQTGNDEIAHLAASFNEMADNVVVLQQARMQHKKRLHNIIKTALDGIVQMDANDVIMDWNPQAEIIFGRSKQEVLGQRLHELIIAADSREIYLQTLQKYLDDGDESQLNQRFSLVAQHANGQKFPIEIGITLSKFEQDIEFNAFIRDLTETKAAAQTLINSEQRYRALFEFSRDAILTLTPDGRFLNANPAAIHLFGCQSEEELLQHTPISLSPPEQPDGSSSEQLAQYLISRALEQGAINFEWRHQRLNGEMFYADIQLSSAEIDNRSFLLASMRDSSQTRQERLALITSEGRIRAILRTMSDAVVLIDAQGTIVLVNEAVCNMYGYEEDELLHQNISMLMTAEHRYAHNGYLERYFATRQRVIIGRRVEVEAVRKDGSTFIIDLAVNELIDDQGTTFLGVMRDISDLKKIEEEREAARMAAEHLVQVKSDFLANMSHEIRTPLNAIIGLARISTRENEGRRNRDNCLRIHEAGLHLLSVVNDVLDFSKIEAGKMALDLHPFQLHILLEDAVNLVELKAKEKKLELIKELPADLPEWVIGDPLRIRQIVVNLLSNAVKFTERGHVTLKVMREGELVKIQVSDSGIGMTLPQVERLFTAFEQADTSTTRRFGGSGLGLAISRNLAVLMHGDIEVESTLGVGSLFTLTIPLPDTSVDFEHVVLSQDNQYRLSEIRVLAAEDVELNRLVLEDVLTQEGASVTFAENGQQILSMVEEKGLASFDIILMDIQMPLMDGYEASRRILKLFPDFPIVGLTAHAMPDERRRCLEAGMRERVTKPIDVNTLVSSILRYALNVNEVDKSRSLDAETTSSIEPFVPEELIIDDDPFAGLQAETPNALVDWDLLLQKYAGRKDFVVKLINNALDGTQAQNIEKLTLAADTQDLDTIKFVAHSLKGVAGVFALTSLLDLAQKTELAAKNKNADVAELALELAALVTLWLKELQAWSAKPENTQA